MESLLANYASSDDEDENEQPQPQPVAAGSSFFSSLPKPKSSSSSSRFSSLPQTHHNPQRQLPKPFQAEEEEEEEDNNNNNSKPASKSSSLFSSLPRPRMRTQQQPLPNPLSPFNRPPPNSINTSKRLVQFKPPVIVPPQPSADDNDDDDEDEEEEERRRRCRDSEYLSQSSSASSSVKSFLSSIPAPKNSSSSTLGVLPSAAGAGRRSILETEALTSSSGGSGPENQSSRLQQDAIVNHDVDYASYGGAGFDQNGGEGVNYGNYSDSEAAGIYQDVGVDDALSYGGYEGHTGYAADYGQYSYTWGGGDAASVPPALAPESFNTAAAGQIESTVGLSGKRRRKDMPTEVVEVKQDELMKNRPREDQAKLTGIAFGPAYQPVSTKGKPSKLHKRKHQIGSLYFDMKQKEMELTERRAKGFLTKAQTQGKYGW